jgi:putrescine transport system substrate-binding protein
MESDPFDPEQWSLTLLIPAPSLEGAIESDPFDRFTVELLSCRIPPMSRCLLSALALCCSFVLTGCGDDPAPAASLVEKPVLNIYNWSDYIAPDTIADFERETGIAVNYDVFDSNEVLEAKLLAGNTGYDIVVPSANFVRRQLEAGLFRPVDRALLSNYAHLDPAILTALAAHDPGNRHVIPYMWGTTGIGYNVAAVAERLPDAPLGSWDLLFDPTVVARLADCGVALVDAPSEVFPAALHYLGLPINTTDPQEIAAAEALLMQVRPYVRYFHSSQYINDLANGEICVAFGWNGDVFIARDRAREAGNGVELAYFIPREGAIMWFDVMAIPHDAPHPGNAHRFLDYILRPAVSAAVSNHVNYANANLTATPLVDPTISDDPAIYPDAATMEMLFPAVSASPEHDRLVTRAWTRIKTGQ